mmetsp:Transcript_15070/g.26807  ORF Transcript_15070/g.26807 Transcript_15070/m.26807 type:complete len:243 (-) Transcript_15070:809-1537(-)
MVVLMVLVSLPPVSSMMMRLLAVGVQLTTIISKSASGWAPEMTLACAKQKIQKITTAGTNTIFVSAMAPWNFSEAFLKLGPLPRFVPRTSNWHGTAALPRTFNALYRKVSGASFSCSTSTSQWRTGVSAISNARREAKTGGESQFWTKSDPRTCRSFPRRYVVVGVVGNPAGTESAVDIAWAVGAPASTKSGRSPFSRLERRPMTSVDSVGTCRPAAWRFFCRGKSQPPRNSCNKRLQGLLR